jgi:hypothetical protein
MSTRRRRDAARVGAFALAFAATAASVSAREWDVEIGPSLLVYDPIVERIPAGESATVSAVGIEASVGARLDPRIAVRLSFAHAPGSESDWESESGGTRATLPTPRITSASLGVEASLHRGRIAPFAGASAGFVVFGEVGEAVTFRSESDVETIRFRLAARTDPSIAFSLGLVMPVAGRVDAAVRYRLLAVFAEDRVDTLDRLSLTARVRLGARP